MSALWNWLFSKQVAPARVPTDTVIPLFRLDDTLANRSLAFDYTMQFEEVLDAEKLAGALWRLIERPGWRKLGARLRDKNALEYHIPTHYTPSRPPLVFTKSHHPCPLSQHPLHSRLPRSNNTLRSFDTTVPLREALELHGHPRYLADWLYADVPQLGLHVVNFEDATFVTLVWGHTLLDAMGRCVLLEAWVAVLEGREGDVPGFVGWDVDPLEGLGVEPGVEPGAGAGASPAVVSKSSVQEKEPGPTEAQPAIELEDFVLKDDLLTGWAKFRFIFNFLWEAIFHPSESTRTICIPALYFSKLRHKAFADLASAPPNLLTYNTKSPTTNTNPTPFLTDADILLAWTLRLLTTSNPTLHPNPLLTLNILNLRPLLSTPSPPHPPLLPPSPQHAYLHNCLGVAYTLFPRAGALLAQPLGHTAAQLRRDLVVQRTRAQVEAWQRLARRNVHLLFGSAGMGISAFSNWSRARLYEVDFRAAVVGGQGVGVEGDGMVVQDGGDGWNVESSSTTSWRKPARPILIRPDGTASKGFILRGSGNCIGVDHNGDVWITVMLRTEFARRLDKEIEALRGADWV
ncbi:hypothetical protein IAQ61_010481 [Plenodomus lingam]|uniref:uncharacterized protein n=1 Tax=Leptosphaeria maculans TaxID=5022 RepID=UPI00331EBC72|nr:hypothetical protein IAQ61_010481 [Plenodomus lingam]